MINISDNVKSALCARARKTRTYFSCEENANFPNSIELNCNCYSSDKDSFIGAFIAKNGTVNTSNLTFDIENKWIELFTGVEIEGVTVFESLGEYLVYEKTSSNQFKIADKRILFNVENDLMLPNDLTLQVLYEAVQEKMILLYPEHFKESDFGELPINTNQIVMASDLEKVSTCANIIELIAQCCASFAYIDYKGTLRFKLFEETGFTIELENLLESWPNTNEIYGPINSVTFGRDGVDDFYTLNDSDSIANNGLTEIAFHDHPIMDANRESYAPYIFERLNGLHYVPMTLKSQGFWFLEPGDIVNVKMKDGTIQKLYVMNHRLNFGGGVSSCFETPALSSTQIECRPPSTSIKEKVDRLERETTSKGILTKITNALNDGTGKIETIEFKMDKDGFHILRGGIDITNELGNIVFTVNEEGNLVLQNIDAKSGKIGLWKINSDGLYSDDTEMRQNGMAHSALSPYHLKVEIENTDTGYREYLLLTPEIFNMMFQDKNGYHHFQLQYDHNVSDRWKMGDRNNTWELVGRILFGDGFTTEGWARVKGVFYASDIEATGTVKAKKNVLDALEMYMSDTNIFDLKLSSGSYANIIQFVQNKSNDQAILRPKTTSKVQLGQASYKWSAVYATNTSIQSDRKHKKNVEHIKKAFKFIMGLEPVQYLMKQGESGRIHYGFIAQDVNALAKSLGENIALAKASHVTYDKKGNPIDNHYDGSADVPDTELEWSLDYNEFIAPLIAVVQKQQKEIIELKNRIAKLEKAFNSLK